MAIDNTKVLFQYGSGGAAAAAVAGALTFDASAQAIYVGANGVANLVTSAVKDATFKDNVLTVSKVDGTAFTLDFSDVASAENVNSLLGTLRDGINTLDASVSTLKGRVDNHDTSLAQLNTSISNLAGAYEDADEALEAKLVGGATEDYNTLGKLETAVKAAKDVADAAQTANEVQTAINNAIDALAGSAEDADDSSFVKVAVTSENGKVKTVTVTTTNIASASDLSGHIADNVKHITADERTAWNDAKSAIDTFLADANMTESAVDTLKELQEYMTSDGAAATELMNRVGANEAAITKLNGNATTEGSVAKAVADAKAELVADASDYKTLAALESAIKAEATARSAADASLAEDIAAIKNGTDAVISFGGAKGAISVDTAPDSSGDVVFVMDGSTLTGRVKGINTAAYEPSTAFDAAGAATTAKDEVTGTAADTSDKVTLYGVKAYATALKTDVDSSIDALQELVGSTSVSTQISAEIEKLDSTLDATSGNYVEKVVIVNGKIDTAASVVKSLPAATVTDVDDSAVADASNYVSIKLGLDNKKVTVNSVAVDTQAVADADASTDGLATAYDVKSYVDSTVNTALAWKVL